MKVTRILLGDTPSELDEICEIAGYLRADIWRRYGALANVGKTASALRTDIVKKRHYEHLRLDGTVRAETSKDIINDILSYKAAAKSKVRQAIAKRTVDEQERKRLNGLLKSDQWLSDSYLHRQMRKYFRHGKSSVSNQFVVRSDRFTTEVKDNRLRITIKIAKKYGRDITLTTTSSGKNVNLVGSNLRIIKKEGYTEIHYVTTKAAGRKCGDRVVGVDKGYTEALTDSDGQHHGEQFGLVMRNYSDKVAKVGKQRNKLYALEKKLRSAGKTVKSDRIKMNNLGRRKNQALKTTTRKRLRGIAYQAAHSVVDKSAVVVSEDLTAVMAKKHQWRRFNRRMNAWVKGTLAQALDSVTKQRGAKHILVNGAYTSQMDSTTGLLEGKRMGDKFYRTNGDVLQADHNAAMNVLARLDDPEISRFTPYLQVRSILLARSPAQLSVKGLELGRQLRQPSADKS